jgi:hypothetical protein
MLDPARLALPGAGQTQSLRRETQPGAGLQGCGEPDPCPRLGREHVMQSAPPSPFRSG